MSTAEEMQYGRGPDIPGWPEITARLKRPSGWKLRGDLELLLDTLQTDVGAAIGHMEKKQWANMLVCIEDAHTGIAKLMDRLRAPARTQPSERKDAQ